MKPIDYIIIILAVAAVVGVVAYNIWKKKNGKGGCGCGCSGCPSAGSCSSAGGCPSVDKEEKDEDENA